MATIEPQDVPIADVLRDVVGMSESEIMQAELDLIDGQPVTVDATARRVAGHVRQVRRARPDGA